MARRLRVAAAVAAAVFLLTSSPASAQQFRVLVFSKTTGFRHASISDGIAMIQALGASHGFAVDATEDAAAFNSTNLARYGVVVWLSTTGDVLGSTQQSAFRSWVEGGGGWVGIHAATDTEYAWPWYGQLIGGDAWFASHPAQQTAALDVEDQSHASTGHMPARFSLFEEWYNFSSNPRAAVNVLVTIDESTYSGGNMGDDHPISWYHEVSAGRSWYTALGHRSETYADDLFRNHVLGGILWAAGADAGATAECAAVPVSGCIAAASAQVDIDERKPGKEKWKASWKKLSSTTVQADFGDPAAGETGYAVCVYDHGGFLHAEARVHRAGHLCGTRPCWKALSTKGYKYGDKNADADGITKLQLKSGPEGKGQVQVAGRNDVSKGKAAMPVGVADGLAGATAAIVQVVGSDAACFSATLTEVQTADGVRFRARLR